MIAQGHRPGGGWAPGALVKGPAGAVISGVMVAALALLIRYAVAGWHFSNDFDQLWFAAQALFRGADPYAAVLQARGRLTYPLYYPLPAVVLVAPLALLPLGTARLAFAGACGFLTGFGLSRLGSHRLLAIGSVPFLASVLDGQMTAALTGAGGGAAPPRGGTAPPPPGGGQ